MGQQSSKQAVSLFHQAVRNGNVEKVNELLTEGVPLEDQDDVFGPPLHEAICFGRFDIAQILIQHKADVNSTSKNSSDTALCVAAKKGLLNFVEALVTGNAKINQPGDGNKTPLHWALENKHHEVARFLIEHNASTSAVDSTGQSPLHAACRLQCNEVVELLLKESTMLNVHDKTNMTPLMYACQVADLKLIELLLKHGATVQYEGNHSTPLHVVHSVDCVRLLLETGDINARDEINATPLHNACGNINDYELVELFIQNKANVGARDKNFATPLHRACCGGAYKNVELLLRCGVDVNAVDSEKNTPLHIAYKLGYTGIANLLIAHQANQSIANAQGLTPIQMLSLEDNL